MWYLNVTDMMSPALTTGGDVKVALSAADPPVLFMYIYGSFAPVTPNPGPESAVGVGPVRISHILSEFAAEGSFFAPHPHIPPMLPKLHVTAFFVTVSVKSYVVDPPEFVAVILYTARAASTDGVVEITPVVVSKTRPVGSAGATEKLVAKPPPN